MWTWGWLDSSGYGGVSSDDDTRAYAARGAGAAAAAGTPAAADCLPTAFQQKQKSAWQVLPPRTPRTTPCSAALLRQQPHFSAFKRT